MDIITNPAFVAVVVMLALCLLRLNVYLAIIVATLVCGVIGGGGPVEILQLFTSGIAAQGENAISIILMGSVAAAIVSTGMGDALAPRISKAVGQRPWTLVASLVLVAAMCETIITFGATFCLIVIPPLLTVFNKYNIDRRKVATAVMCGLQIGFVCIPIGFGAMFQQIVASSMIASGVEDISYMDVAASAWPIGIAMIVAAVGVSFVYRKPRIYTPVPGVTAPAEGAAQLDEGAVPPWELKHTLGIVAAFITPVIQMTTGSLPLGAIVALALIAIFRISTFQGLDVHINSSIKDVAAVIFIMIAGSGFAVVSNSYGDVAGLVEASVSVVGSNKLIGAFAMLFLGLIVTLGIGSSWGTVPIVASLIVPMGLELGFSITAIAMLICGAGVLGDAGSPASDQTLMPTATLNLDGQHDHIWDTCVPSFICCNVPILILCPIFACFL